MHPLQRTIQRMISAHCEPPHSRRTSEPNCGSFPADRGPHPSFGGASPLSSGGSAPRGSMPVILGLENRCLAFLHIEPALAQGVDDVGLVRDEESVFALFGHLRQHLAKCRSSPAIFVG